MIPHPRHLFNTNNLPFYFLFFLFDTTCPIAGNIHSFCHFGNNTFHRQRFQPLYNVANTLCSTHSLSLFSILLTTNINILLLSCKEILTWPIHFFLILMLLAMTGSLGSESSCIGKLLITTAAQT